MKPRPLKILVVLFLTALCVSPHPAHADSFDDAQQAALKQNPAGVQCMLQTVTGATRFRVGETIPVRLSLTSAAAGWRACIETSRYWAENEFQVSPKAGCRSVLPYKSPGYSGPPARIVALARTPANVDLTLNDYLRFDFPGVYRVFVETRRLLPAVAPGQRAEDVQGELPVASSVLTLTILPLDPKWAHRQVRDAVRRLRKRNYDTPPLYTLQYLGTREAAQAMLEQLAREPLANRATPVTILTALGLYQFPDQAWLASEVDRDIARRDLPISEQFITTVARVPASEGLRQSTFPEMFDPAGFWSAVEHRWLQIADALPNKSRDAQARTAYSLASLLWRWGDQFHDPAIAARTAEVQRIVVGGFDGLPAGTVNAVLSDEEWPHLQHDSILKALLSLWSRVDAVEKEDPGLPERLMRRIYEMAPEGIGRKIVLSEMIARKPHTLWNDGFPLPDAEIPQIEGTLFERIRTDRDENTRSTRSDLLSRYASPAIFPRVTVWYERNGVHTDCYTRAGVLAYCLRVDSKYGMDAIEAALHESKPDYCGHLLSAMTLTNKSAQLAAIAAAHKHDADPVISADAKRALEIIGASANAAAPYP